MIKFQNLGFFSGNELFAMKKNVGEDAKLREKLGILSLELHLTNSAMRHDIKTVRQDLKEIYRSTGRSPQGIPTIRQTSKTSVSNSFPSRVVPQRIFEQIINSNYGRNFDIYDRNIQTQEGKSKKIRAMTETVHSYNDLEIFLRNIRHRKIKSDGETSKQLLSIEHSPVKSRNCVPNRTSYTSSPLEDDVFDSSDSNHKESLQSASIVKNVDQPNVNVDESDFEKIEISQDQSNPGNISPLYNPWKVHHRTGKTVDPLEIPQIKDCYRPVCRPNCSTCLARKKKMPCFLVPGINVSHDHFNISEQNTTEDEGKKKQKKKKKKKRKINSEYEVNGHSSLHIDHFHDSGNEQNQTGVENESFMSECLQIKKNTGKRVINKRKLKELSIPKDGFRKELRFSKTFIQKGLERMKQSDPLSQLTVAERRRLHKVQGQISIFMAVLNERRLSQIKPINEVLDFPIMEDHNSDFSHLHQPVSLPKFDTLGTIRRRKVCFK